jgi:hypothetical protein
MSQRNERSVQVETGGVTPWLIHYVARFTPPCLSARLEEEWLADLESRSSAASRLRFAAGCCWATIIIVNDHSRSLALAPSPAGPASGVFAPRERNFGHFSLRSGTLFLIIGLHSAVFCGLVMTISHARALVPAANLESHQANPPPPESEIQVLSLGK